MTDAASAPRAPDRANRRMLAGLGLSLLAHGVILAIQFGVPGMEAGSAGPITVTLAPVAPPVVGDLPVSASPAIPAPLSPVSHAPELTTPLAPPLAAAQAPRPPSSGFQLRDPVPLAPPPAPAKPVRQAAKRRRPRPGPPPLQPGLETPVIAQLDDADSLFKLPPPELVPEDSPAMALDPAPDPAPELAQAEPDTKTLAQDDPPDAEAPAAAEALAREQEAERIAAEEAQRLAREEEERLAAARLAAEQDARLADERRMEEARRQDRLRAQEQDAQRQRADEERRLAQARAAEDSRAAAEQSLAQAQRERETIQVRERQLAAQREQEAAARAFAEQQALAERQRAEALQRERALAQQREEEQQRQRSLARQRLDEERRAREAALASARRAAEQEAERLALERRQQADAARRLAEQQAQQREEEAARRAEQLAQQKVQEQLQAQQAQQAQQAEQAERQRALENARREAGRTALADRASQPGAGSAFDPGLDAGAGRGSGAGGNGNAASVPRSMLGSDLALRAREMMRGIDIPANPPAALRAAREAARRIAVAADERDVPVRMYVDSFRQKIERTAAQIQMRVAPAPARYDPLVSVAVRSDGSIDEVVILRSSGRPDTDEAIRRIVHLNARYAAFPPNVAARFDVIEIRRIWTFAENLKLLEEVR